MRVVRVGLVDDHRVVRRGIRTLLESCPDLAIVGEASSAEELLQQVAAWDADVVVMDLLLPGGLDGIMATREVRNSTPRTQVVVLTSYTDDMRVLAALRAGAIGYVRKDAEPEVLILAVRAAAQGQSLLDPAVSGRIRGEQGVAGSHDLTERELTVLRALAHGSTNREIALALTVSEETIKTHVTNILGKLQRTHRTQAVIYALKQGFIGLDEIDI